MRHLNWLPGACAALALAGCEPANRYNVGSPRATNPVVVTRDTSRSTTTTSTRSEPPPPLAPELAWSFPWPSKLEQSARLEFVAAADQPQEWDQLKGFWSETLTQGNNPAYLGQPPFMAAATVAGLHSFKVVKIKVPLGLDDPTPHIPLSNPPTAAKWALGKKLFFDDSWLQETAFGRLSCANCHQPEHGFRSTRAEADLATPPLANVVYHTHQFWDGRVGSLEEVVQRSLEDERPSAQGTPRPHTWSGIVGRLRKSGDYLDRFARVFGTDPNTDGVGKALATYVRTILVGDSVYDRARRQQRQRNGNALEPADFEKVLDDAALKGLGKEPALKTEVAKQLHAGQQLFTGKARCVQCHGGSTFTDNGFHNLGWGDSAVQAAPGQGAVQLPGRFGALPVGLKDLRMIGAYKTPSLRGLPREGFFHDGKMRHLDDAILYHLTGGQWNEFLDAELRDPKQPSQSRDLNLSPTETQSLVLFVRALAGEPPPASVRDANVQP